MADLSDEQKRQLKNCYEVIRKYQEKQKMNPNRTRFGKKQIIEKKNNDSRTISRMLSGVKHLTPEDRIKGTKMLDDLEHDRGHNRGRGR